MNFEYNETQSMIAQSIRDFAEKNIRPNIMEWDEAQIFPIPLFKKLGEMGFMGVLVPEEYVWCNYACAFGIIVCGSQLFSRKKSKLGLFFGCIGNFSASESPKISNLFT